jgi:hypothetical protein
MNIEKCKCGGTKRQGYYQCRKCYLEYYANRTEKLCRGCNCSLPLDCFRKRPDGVRPRSRCQECEAKAARDWRKANPEEHKKRKKAWALKYPEKVKKASRRRSWRRVLGLDPDIVEAYLSTHNGLCDICGCPPNGQAHAIDHCHKQGYFRGVLCLNCNNGLGHFKDSQALLLKAADYLKRSASCTPGPSHS